MIYALITMYILINIIYVTPCIYVMYYTLSINKDDNTGNNNNTFIFDLKQL